MINNDNVITPADLLQRMRVKRLYDELAFALSRTDGAVVRGWGKRAAGRLPHLGARRVGGLAHLASGLVRLGGQEISGFYKSLRHGHFGQHFGQRTATAIDGTLTIGSEGRRFLVGTSRALLRDPKGMVPKVLGAFLGFYTGSGGVDGNGGVPDLDLLAGIGHHRSPLTHSIIAGVLAEGALLALVDLAAEIHGRLPHDHDVLWDGLEKVGRPFAESALVSLSAGIAWHLLVDAGIQPAPYHDLPFSMPIEAHQAVFATNGMAEVVDAAERADRVAQRPSLLEQQQKRVPTTGERVVSGVSNVAQHVGYTGREMAKTIAKSLASRVRRTSKQ